MTSRITIRKPDDWHLHVRDGEMLKATLPIPPRIRQRHPDAEPDPSGSHDRRRIACHERANAALPHGATFEP